MSQSPPSTPSTAGKYPSPPNIKIAHREAKRRQRKIRRSLLMTLLQVPQYPSPPNIKIAHREAKRRYRNNFPPPEEEVSLVSQKPLQ